MASSSEQNTNFNLVCDKCEFPEQNLSNDVKFAKFKPKLCTCFEKNFQKVLLPLLEEKENNVSDKKSVELATDFKKRTKNILLIDKFSQKVVLLFSELIRPLTTN